MIRHVPAFSPRKYARVVRLPFCPDIRGRRECRAPVAPAALRAKIKSTQASHHGHTGDIRHSPRNGFNGFLRGLPGEPGLLPPSPAAIATGLIPASGYQDATTSPSATPVFAKRLRRARRRSSLGTSASTASPAPRFVTIAKRPSCGQKTRGKMPVICPSSQAERPAAHWHDGQISSGRQTPSGSQDV
jgi:hypothetical protein